MQNLVSIFLNSLYKKKKQLVVSIFDIIICIISIVLAFSIRLEEFYIPSIYDLKIFIISIIIYLPIFIYFGFYKEIFRYSNLAIFNNVFKSTLIYGVIFFGILVIFSWKGIPRSIGIIQPLIFFIFIISSRIFASHLTNNYNATSIKKNIIIYGAGKVGAETLSSINNSKDYKAVSFIDDDKSKINKNINGIKISSKNDLQEIIKANNVSEIFIAINNINSTNKKHLLHNLINYDVRVKVAPGVENLLSESLQDKNFEALDFKDLLDRDLSYDKSTIKIINNMSILISGAGGSIGSEICRQIISHKPASIILLDNNEFGLYEIHQEIKLLLKKNNYIIKIIPVLANIRNKDRLSKIFTTYKPDIVYHAAAYKHVPLLENNISESVLNNILGTYNIASCAFQISKNFILISTDKAVRPTNIMGATKRISELCIQMFAEKYDQKEVNTKFSIVRFGNVLGSSGSVIPLFIKQIKLGGPITITHPDVKRYLMTIPEAVNLVLQASNLSNGGDILVLEMGEQIKIEKLAKKLIKLSGLRPIIVNENHQTKRDGDIEIEYIGLRPGEKLYEELFLGSNLSKTTNPLIHRARENYISEKEFNINFNLLVKYAREENDIEILKILQTLVDGFKYEKK